MYKRQVPALPSFCRGLSHEEVKAALQAEKRALETCMFFHSKDDGIIPLEFRRLSDPSAWGASGADVSLEVDGVEIVTPIPAANGRPNGSGRSSNGQGAGGEAMDGTGTDRDDGESESDAMDADWDSDEEKFKF